MPPAISTPVFLDFLCLQTNANVAPNLLSYNCMFSLKLYRFKFFKIKLFCTKISFQIARFSISCYNKISQTLPEATTSHNFKVFAISYSHRGARGRRCFSLPTVRSVSALSHFFPFVYSSTSPPETYTCSLAYLLYGAESFSRS